MQIPAILYRAPATLAVAAAIAVIPVSSSHPQSTNADSLPSDAEIRGFLVEGEEWANGSREDCSDQKIVFKEDGIYLVFRYENTPYGSGSEWVFRGRAGENNFVVENGVLVFHSHLHDGIEHTVNSASPYQIETTRETPDGEQTDFTYVNCTVSDEEFASGPPENTAEQEAEPFLGAESEETGELPSIEHVVIRREVSDQEQNLLFFHSRYANYRSREGGRIVDEILFEEDPFCRFGINRQPRITFGCEGNIGAVSHRRRRLSSEDEIIILSNYENNCLEDRENLGSREWQFTEYGLEILMEGGRGYSAAGGWGYSAEQYTISCTVPHEEARDRILSGNLLLDESDFALVCGRRFVSAEGDLYNSLHLSQTKDAIPMVFPDYVIRDGDDEYRNLGHAGILLINPDTGLTRYYEYGRYGEDNNGEVRNIGPIPDVEIDVDGMPTRESLERVLREISKRAGRGGRRERISGAYIRTGVSEFQQMEQEARDGSRGVYSPYINNCGHFVDDVLEAGGINTPLIFMGRAIPIVYLGALRGEHPSITLGSDGTLFHSEELNLKSEQPDEFPRGTY